VYFGHIAIVPGTLNPVEYGDALLPAARYVGVYRSKDKATNEDIVISGGGLEMWLGDEDGIGDVFETAVNLATATFPDSIRAVLPPGGSIIEGTLHSVAGTYSGTHQYVTPRKAIDYITQLFGAEWRVNNNGTLDAGVEADLFVTDPQTILVAKEDADDLRYKALPGRTTMGRDVEDFTTRVVVLGEGEGDTIAVGTADNPYNPYNDLHGNGVVVKRIVSESSTTGVNVNDRAAVILNQYAGERPKISLSTTRYDVKGDVSVGDYIWVYDPDVGFEDGFNEVNWRGEIINPVKLRCIELTWPIRRGWTVAFRDNAGVWLDLSPWVFFEGGETTIVVGELPRSLTSGTGEPLNGRENPPDTTIPAAPLFTNFSLGSYQSTGTGFTRSAIQATWTVPLNTDTSTIVDGGHYEVRYRVSQVLGYRVKWGQLEVFKWGALTKWGAPITEPVSASPEWQTAYVPWGTNTFTILELTPGVTYELQVRAVDAQIPAHLGPFSASSFVTTVNDIFPPSTPAAPEVAGSRMAIQVIHRLGKSTGGTFNLEQDLDHLEIHVGGSDSFYPDESTRKAKVVANSGMINAQIPIVVTVPLEQVDGVYVRVVAVDHAGNKSNPSPTSTVTVLLIDDQHISDLTVSKVTAGTIFADWLLAASIKTATTGSRAELSNAGLSLYNSSNQETVKLDSATANIRVLEGRLEVIDASGNTIVELGKTSDGRYGLRVNNTTMDPQIRAGELASGGYGLEAVDATNQLVSLSTLAFGIRAALVSALGTCSSTTFGNTTGTTGPAVTTIIGPSGRAIVFLSATITCSPIDSVGTSSGGSMSFMTDDGTITPSDDRAVGMIYTKDGIAAPHMSAAIYVSGITPGSRTFTARYRSIDSGKNIAFEDRTIIVFPY
jgi:hypothetical protein